MSEIKDMNIVVWIVGSLVGVGLTVVGGLLLWSIKSLITSIVSLRMAVVEIKAILPIFKEKQDKSEKDINNAFQRIQKLESKGADL